MTKLQDSLLELAKIYPTLCHCELIHGGRSDVVFDERSHWVTGVGPTCQKELADILFVVYSKKKRMIRLCFMQNKCADRATSERFSADLLQLDLLHNRSGFTVDAKGRGAVNTLLSHSREASVAVYGLFYKKGDSYDMDLYAAPGLKPKNPCGFSKKRIVGFDPAAALAASLSPFRDEVMLKGLEDIGSALVECAIGRVIKMDAAEDLDVLRGLAGFSVCPEGLRKEAQRSVEMLEEQIIRRDERHDKKNEYVDFEVVNQVFFIDADMVMERKEQ